MNITEALRGALRRLAGRSAPQRRTLPLPSILNSYGPRSDHLPKPTPANLRRFAETPVARKAINTIKDRVAGMRWRVQPKNARDLAEVAEGEKQRVSLGEESLRRQSAFIRENPR